jgi:hypothetical protein
MCEKSLNKILIKSLLNIEQNQTAFYGHIQGLKDMK